jgi:phosphoribosyl-AMP cyclohydrolase / phosphoribosyl-ATP pyrophosphohydrolase
MKQIAKPNFSNASELIPCIVQDIETNTVLMLGYMNEEAFQKTLADKKVTFFSRSKQRLWTKGETSGNYLLVKEIRIDCDGDTLLIKAHPTGPVCHTGSDTCFSESNQLWNLKQLEKVIQDRKKNAKEGSYTRSLFNSGINKIAQKVGEEAVELVIESKDNNTQLFLEEAADLLYHTLVLLAAKDCTLEQVEKILEKRQQ